ncbi:hypothetical protein [Achromobacter animicus]|uniref:hypothetical protein n=1 Tax=Achromobacter animicus TaxID=1389935 RepID=UPI0028A7E649|nr:hypothetical protein [Achromobacter animicus]
MTIDAKDFGPERVSVALPWPFGSMIVLLSLRGTPEPVASALRQLATHDEISERPFASTTCFSLCASSDTHACLVIEGQPLKGVPLALLPRESA